MKIAGLQKLTLLDYPGKTAATVFTPGCNFRCPFCHNADLVAGILPAQEDALGVRKHLSVTQGEGARPSSAPEGPHGTADMQGKKNLSDPADCECAEMPFPSIPEETFFAFLGKRHRLLDGVCVSGGEPTLQPELAAFCARVKNAGFDVKLDTNGTRPAVLQALLSDGLVDFVAMDVKNAPERYAETAGVADLSLASLEESMLLLLSGTVPFEFRTTVVRELHSPADLQSLACWIARLAQTAGVQTADVTWHLQSFEDAPTVLAGEKVLSPWRDDELRNLVPSLREILPRTSLRGIDESR